MRKELGVATLIITLILMVGATLIMLFAAQYSVLQQKTSANQFGASKAFAAAEGGLEYAMAFLQANSTIVLASPSAGFINYTFPTVTQADGSSYTVVVTNQQANNYDLLTVTATGWSSDNLSTQKVVQDIYAFTYDSHAVITPKNLILSGSSTITGSVDVGQTVTLGNNSAITTITQNDTDLAALSNDTLFANIFGVNKITMQSQSTYYANSSFNPAILAGKSWIDADFKISGNTVIGSPTNPVLIIVNGNFTASGSATIYGMIYVMGTVKVTGTLNFNGGLVAENDITLSGNSSFNQNLIKPFVLTSYAKIPGSWKDF